MEDRYLVVDAVIRRQPVRALLDRPGLPAISLTAGITAGLLRREDPVLLTTAILGVTSHLARVFVLERGDDADRVAEAAIAFCRKGFLATE